MVASPDQLRAPAFVGVLLSGTAASVVLNIPSLHFEPLLLWVRALCPALLAIGIWASLRGFKSLRTLGWFGVFLFIICAVGMVFPGEDYMSGGPDAPPFATPRMATAHEIVLRLILFMTLIATLVFCYFRIGRLRKVV